MSVLILTLLHCTVSQTLLQQGTEDSKGYSTERCASYTRGGVERVSLLSDDGVGKDRVAHAAFQCTETFPSTNTNRFHSRDKAAKMALYICIIWALGLYRFQLLVLALWYYAAGSSYLNF